MIQVAIIEDEPSEQSRLSSFVERYGKEHNVPISVSVFQNAVDFVTFYKPKYDIIFLDIQMPGIDGMSAAKKIRDKDALVQILFATNLAQFAIEGYDVSAVDFLVKPIRYELFETAMARAEGKCRDNAQKEYVVRSGSGIIRIALNDLRYVEVREHNLIYYTTGGTIERWGSLKQIKDSFPQDQFVLCNSSYLVNLLFVRRLEGEFLILDDGTKLIVSRSKRKNLLMALTNYIEG